MRPSPFLFSRAFMKAKDIVLLHAQLWKERYGENLPIPWSKSTAQISRVLKSISADQLVAYIRYYYSRYQSRFADRTGHSIGAFISELPAIIAAFQEDERKRTAAGATEINAGRLESARRNEE